MRSAFVLLCLVAVSLCAFGQAGNGTITGTVSDPAGAVVANASVEARNAETGVVYPTATTNAGNFTVSQLPPGTYEITVKVPGFKTYTHTNLALQAAAVLREDVAMQVGAATEAVTVTEQASLLNSETADVAHNITVNQLDSLPILGIGTASAGASGIRNPFALLQLIPGSAFDGVNRVMVINGTANNTAAMRVEGQDSRNNSPGVISSQVRQPSPDAVQEVAVQTSNYAPEFGTAGGAVINMTMKSGTNQFHGSGYDYFVNEDLNAAGSFSNDGTGHKVLPRNRRNDFGGTLGGPVWIPKVYDGRNKTFFFYSWEQYRETTGLTFNDTVPAPAYLNGDFSAISSNGTCSLCKQYGVPTTPLGPAGSPALDALGRQFFANTIYDPLSRAVNPANNLGYANPFPNNMIPKSRIDPSTVKFESVLPAAQNNNLTQNYAGNIPSVRITTIPSIKIDEAPNSKDKFSFYYSTIGTAAAVAYPLGNADGLPLEIGQYRGTYIDSKTIRFNYDRIITPTLLLHLGAGWQRVNFNDAAPFESFDPSAFGLSGFVIHRQFPSVTGMCVLDVGNAYSCSAAGLGGMQPIGTSGQAQTDSYYQKPTYNANLTKVRGPHTYKFGGEAAQMGALSNPFAGVTLPTGLGPTSQPFTPTVSFNGLNTGFGYASWLLGDYNSTTQTPLEDYRQGHMSWAFFAQDSWKVTRKLTVDYGLRWEYSTPIKEEHGRVGQFDPNAPNANAGGHPGAVMYATTCNCSFYRSAYPYAWGPRLGAAYQLDNKTVIRAGWGVVYQFPTDDGVPTIGSNAINAPSGINPIVNIESPNPILQPVWPVTDPNIYPAKGTTTPAPLDPDRNFNRTPRQNQWSIGVQREITHNFVLEAAYVANRVAWLSAGGVAGATAPGTVIPPGAYGTGSLGFLSQISEATFAKYGLNPYTNYADYQLLLQPINSAAVMTRMRAAGVGNNGLVLPYTGFPQTNSLLSALYPFPQFFSAATGPLAVAESPTGNSKYDSLQIKASKRLSHGLQAAGSYTWAKGFVRNNRQDFFNPASSVWSMQQIPPQLLTFNVTYITPKADFIKNRYANLVLQDWQLGIFTQYQSAPFLIPPTSATANFLTSEAIRVPGQPLYLKPVNGQINAYTDQVLNPAAWQQVPAGGTGPAIGTLYSDFRGRRRPQENFNFGRNFRVKERYNLQIRAEFVNIFNRTLLQSPISANPQLPLSKNGLNQLTGGFGVINATAAVNTVPALNGSSRAGTLIARFTF
ncbi:MAG TPA: TonB-dependent receptor [Bryobacteraceae bacterium]|nr:TonB-dependent receptor [Bryobacteraceae bacterium]